MSKRKRCSACGTLQARSGHSAPWNKIVERHNAPCGLPCSGGRWGIEIDEFNRKSTPYHASESCTRCREREASR